MAGLLLRTGVVALAAALSTGLGTGLGTGMGSATAMTRSVPEPVILVHGWNGTPDAFAPMKTALEQAGHPTYAIDLPGEENVANASAIAALVEQVRQTHGADKVSLVGHSMGGLSARHYLKSLGGAAKTLGYVSMGTGQRGYWPACLLPTAQGGQMCPTSTFMRQLNSGDPTPGAVRYTVLASSLDETRADTIDGVACTAELPGVQHADEPGNQLFIDAVLTVLDGRCPAP
ncbi:MULTISPECIES: alpha/beta fold hydrolase [unclassified Nonomuraea]|uniref:esterase/lipase family protein n=1 Tax=unclassified Nonomuraea TaxID=2593643 RepID=UPI0033FDA8C2